MKGFIQKRDLSNVQIATSHSLCVIRTPRWLEFNLAKALISATIERGSVVVLVYKNLWLFQAFHVKFNDFGGF